MNRIKFKLVVVLTSAIVLVAFTHALAADGVEWNIQKTLQLEETPLDVAIAPNGRRLFVLTEQGKVLVYSSNSKLEAKIDVGKYVDQIKSGPQGETLILMSGENKTVQIVTLDFIQNINITGAPFKGPEDAAVVIAVFDDFQ